MSTPFLKSLAQVNAFGNTVGVEGPLSQVESLSVSAAGSNVVGVLSNAQAILPSNVVLVTAAAGAGAYTSIVALGSAYHLAGDRASVLVTLPASANPTIVIRDTSATGTILATIANSGAGARKVTSSLTFNGLAWVVLSTAVVVTSIT